MQKIERLRYCAL